MVNEVAVNRKAQNGKRFHERRTPRTYSLDVRWDV